MARTIKCPSDAPPTIPRASSLASPNRVKKGRSERMSSRHTRQSSKSMDRLSHMVNELHNDAVRGSDNHNAPNTSKSKGRAAASQHTAASDLCMEGEPFSNTSDALQDECVAPIEDKPFPIMELPTEIRLEIYRACLTRPYNILLSKREQVQQPDSDDSEKAVNISDSQSDPDDTEDDNQAAQSASIISRPSATLHQGPAARRPPPRTSRPVRLLSSRSASVTPVGSTADAQGGHSATTAGAPAARARVSLRSSSSRLARRNTANRKVTFSVPEPPRNQAADPLVVNILRASKEIYKEARSVLYSENYFTLDLNTAMGTLACLHQRSRRQIKHAELEIPTYNEILERFQETVRLSLRYCSGLKKFVIHMPFTLPGADGSGTTGNTTVYANGFDILRWLPQECEIALKGNVCMEIETVVNKHLALAKTLDKVRCQRHQFLPMTDKEIKQYHEHRAQEHRRVDSLVMAV